MELKQSGSMKGYVVIHIFGININLTDDDGDEKAWQVTAWFQTKKKKKKKFWYIPILIQVLVSIQEKPNGMSCYSVNDNNNNNNSYRWWWRGRTNYSLIRKRVKAKVGYMYLTVKIVDRKETCEDGDKEYQYCIIRGINTK